MARGRNTDLDQRENIATVADRVFADAIGHGRTMTGSVEAEEGVRPGDDAPADVASGRRTGGVPTRAPREWVPTRAILFSIRLHLVAATCVIAQPAAWTWGLGLLLLNHLVLAALGIWPRGDRLGPNLSRLPEAARHAGIVALTFDDGPDPRVTRAILDVLDRFGATASFFCVAERAARHPDLVREIARRGHSVENHSDRHRPTFACLSLRAMARDIAKAQTRLAALTGQAPAFFRAPYGIRSPLLDPALAAAGLSLVSWTRRGFDTTHRDPDQVLRRLTRRIEPGDIILLHDAGSARTPGGEPVALAVLPRLLAHIEASGLRVVSLPAALNPSPSLAAAGSRSAGRRHDPWSRGGDVAWPVRGT